MGGVEAAHGLRHLLAAPHRVVVVDKEQWGSYPPAYGWLMTSARKPSAILRDRTRLARKGIEFVPAEVWQIDLEAQLVRADSRELKYDYLVIALGAEGAVEETPGLAEIGQTFSTLEGAERLAASLRYISGGRVVITAAGASTKSPQSLYEGAMLIEHYFHDRHMRQKVEIDVYTPERWPLEAFGREAAELIVGQLAHKGIGLHLGVRVESVDPAHHELRFTDGSSTTFDSLIATPVQRSPQAVRETLLTDEDGWLPVNPRTLESGARNVFAVGDIIRIDLPGGGVLPRTGNLARGQAQAVARTIASRVLGRGAPGAFDGRAHLLIDVGAGAACAVTTSFYVPGRPTEVRQPSIVWHAAKVAMEKYWLARSY
jgi:sulfide:quinone oxidoreductase